MTADTTLDASLAYYARHGAALFPIPARKKDPWGIIHSFAHDFSTDPAQWAAWRAANPDCNFGLVAGPSRLIIVDTDIKELGRERAWRLYAEWFTSRGLPVYPPHVQSASGGWHTLFSVPESTDLKQPALIQATEGSKKAIVEVRAGNGYVVAAGSYYDGQGKGEPSGPYLFLTDAPPHSAPPHLVEHCSPSSSAGSAIGVGTRDPNDTATLLKWMAQHSLFNSYEDWTGAGMALRLEFGDTVGLPLWRLTHLDDGKDKSEANHWASFATEPGPGVQTLNTLMKRAHAAGWIGSIRSSASHMFAGLDAVASMAAASGADLPGTALLGRADERARLANPILQEFMDATSGEPSRPAYPDFPQLPPDCSSNPLFSALNDCIARVMAMADSPKTFKADRVIAVLAILAVVHPDTFDSVARRLTLAGCKVSRPQIKSAAIAFEERTERAFVPQEGWILDSKGFPEANNSDNIPIFFQVVGVSVRWNAWLERAEVRGGNDPDLHWDDWTYFDDTVAAKLRTRGNRTKTRFLPGKDFFWESVLAFAHVNSVDPARSLLDQLQSDWDGVPRLDGWLSKCCHIPQDDYHVAVSRNIIGGIVKRIRNPGIKFDTMAVFYGPQGTGKSTMAAILALRPEWFTDSIMFGTESKELVLSLAGKAVCEISEMGMRGSTNANHVKAMISRQVDAGRTAYARSVTERARRNIWIGTTNSDTPLEDPSGNRRFLPVEVATAINLGWLSSNVQQLVGEAATLESRGIDFNLHPSIWNDAAKRQEAARVESDIEIRLETWFGLTTFTENAYVVSADLSQLASMVGWRSGNSGERKSVMQRLGFRQETPYLSGKKTRVWYRGAPTLPANIESASVRYEVDKTDKGLPKVTPRGPTCLPS